MSRPADAGWALVTAALVAGAVRSRRRLATLPVLAAAVGAVGPDGGSAAEGAMDGGGGAGSGGAGSAGAGSAAAAGDGRETGDRVLLRALGAEVDPATVAAAAAHADAGGLDVLDLVPADLPAVQLLELLGQVDPSRYPENADAPGRGALQATVVSGATWRRVAGPGTSFPVGPSEVVLDPAAHLRAMEALKAVTGVTWGLAIAPGVRAAALTPEHRRVVLDAAAGHGSYAVLAGRLVAFVVLARALARRRRGAAAALAAYCAQPVVAAAGTAVHPPRLGAVAAGRLLAGPAATGRMAVAPHGLYDGDAEAARGRYATLLAQGTDRFFEPRRADCPWCGGTRLAVELRTPDLHQHKPGRFELDRCTDCGHVFQNPRLSADGLDFYYLDFYDGLGGSITGKVFGASGPVYRQRVDLLAAHVHEAPRRWLDVGAGHGHFCRVARERFPGTSFDGLDLGAGVEAGARAGWLDHAIRGLFVQQAPKLSGAYDVVSMHHYLEHTTDIRAELAAAATVLLSGGHLLVEMPDPQFPLRRLLRGTWAGYLQPQHLHMPPIANLAAAMEDAGLEVVAQQLVPEPMAANVVGGVLELWSRLAPLPDLPWRPPTGLAGRLRPLALAVLAGPALVAGGVLDLVWSVVRLGRGHGNAYRIVARRR